MTTEPDVTPACTCIPCTTPGMGHPAYEHCAACCAGSGIEEYDPLCPWGDHAEMGERQFGPVRTFSPFEDGQRLRDVAPRPEDVLKLPEFAELPDLSWGRDSR